MSGSGWALVAAFRIMALTVLMATVISVAYHRIPEVSWEPYFEATAAGIFWTAADFIKFLVVTRTE